MAIAEVQCSHTLTLVDEALGTTLEYCASRHTEELKRPPNVGHLHGVTRVLNRAVERFGLHVARVSYVRTAEASGYSAFGKWTSVGTLRSIMEDPRAFDDVYGLFADETSRLVYDWYIKCRVAYAFVGEAALRFFPARESRLNYEHLCQSLHRAKEGGYRTCNLVIRCDPTVLVDTFALEQYNLKEFVEPSRGWVALDVGAYKGETALWLAQKLGSSGRVFAFEPNPPTRAVLQSNLQGNASSDMAPIVVMPYGVGAMPGMQLFVGTAGAGSLIDNAGESRIPVTCIDDVVSHENLDRVDFIKMDIEGGEADALKGARVTMKAFGPRLAICVYHKPRDLPDIVALIRETRPDYEFRLSHKSPGLGDTVLFARVSMSSRDL